MDERTVAAGLIAPFANQAPYGRGAGAGEWRIARLPEGPPLLQVVVDTEEEFDWGRPFRRESVAVVSMEAQHRAQALFAPHGLTPTYVMSYPVAATASSVAVLKPLHDAGACRIGAHLHPWVNPPFDEPVTTFNSYAGNLPQALERAKLSALTEQIEDAFGHRPHMYKAGRYGFGPHTAGTLRALGYDIDLSIAPHSDLSADGGPDFRDCTAHPAWIGGGEALFEVPLTRGFSGALAPYDRVLHSFGTHAAWRRLRLGAVLARLGLLEFCTLSPEGVDSAAHRRLVRAMLARGHRVFTLSYHSPSLAPGHTPYVRTAADLDVFLDRIKRLLDLFFDELGAQPTTPEALRRMAVG